MNAVGLHIITSNALEILVQELSALLAQPLESALQPDTVLVQSKGMQRWISLAVAEHNGICANIDFPFPNAFFERVYNLTIGPLRARIPMNPKFWPFASCGYCRNASINRHF